MSHYINYRENGVQARGQGYKFFFSRKDFWDRVLRYWFPLNMLNSIDQLQLTLSTKTGQITALKACSHPAHSSFFPLVYE